MKVDSFNALVRALVTLGLAFGMIWGFLIAKSIGSEAYMTAAMTAIGFWFGQRGTTTKQEPPTRGSEPS